MPRLTMSDVTRILSQIESGSPHAAEKLLPLVYDELRRLAANRLAYEKPGQSLLNALRHQRTGGRVVIYNPLSQDSTRWHRTKDLFSGRMSRQSSGPGSIEILKECCYPPLELLSIAGIGPERTAKPYLSHGGKVLERIEPRGDTPL